MNQAQFDVIILGESLAGRVAAAILARAGLRLLSLQPAADPIPAPWCFSSTWLERLMEQMDGRTLLTHPIHFQYLCGSLRLDLHGPNPLREELRREIPRQAAQIEAALNDLEVLGNRLAEVIGEGNGLPLAGDPARVRFVLRCLRRGITPGRLKQPVAGRLAKLDPSVAALLGGLLGGLTLTPPERLSVAEAALLWHGANAASGISPAGLDELLLRRFRQFHGEEEDLVGLEGIEAGARQPIRVRLKGGRLLTCTKLIVASPELLRHLSSSLPAAQALDAPPAVMLSLGDKLTPVLAEHLILDGCPPLRLSFSGLPAQRVVQVEGSEAADRNTVQERLAKLLPFATFKLAADLPAPPRPERNGLAGAAARAIPARDCYLCHRAVLPALGSSGEVLIGRSVATNILSCLKRPAV